MPHRALLLAALVLTGCGSLPASGPTTRADLLRDAPPELAEVNEAMADGRFQIVLDEARRLRSIAEVVVLPDVSYYRRDGEAQWQFVDTGRIVRVERLKDQQDGARARRFALRGALPGVLMLAGGIAMAMSAEEVPAESNTSKLILSVTISERAVGKLIAGVGGAVGLFGAGIGAVIGGSVQQVESTPYRAPLGRYLAPRE